LLKIELLKSVAYAKIIDKKMILNRDFKIKYVKLCYVVMKIIAKLTKLINSKIKSLN